MNKLEQLKTMTTVVADTGDLEAIRQFSPVDATTNPALVLKAAQLPAYKELVTETLSLSRSQGGGSEDQLNRAIEALSVAIGCEVLRYIPGRISTEVSARYSFDRDAMVACARRLMAAYAEAGVGADRVLIKLASTWQGIEAARVLEAEKIQCNLTLLFGFAQAQACGDAGVFLISPFVGRILDWHKAQTGKEHYPASEDPGVQSVTRIYNYYKRHGYKTVVMGASFRNREEVLALAGCDRLTISPQLLEELQSESGVVERQLNPDFTGEVEDKASLDEEAFCWHMNEDVMATEKLAEGIRNFYRDEVKLREYLAGL